MFSNRMIYISIYFYLSCTVNCLNKKKRNTDVFSCTEFFSIQTYTQTYINTHVHVHTHTYKRTHSFLDLPSRPPRSSSVHVCVYTNTYITYSHTREHKNTRRKFDQLQPHDLSRKFKEVDRH